MEHKGSSEIRCQEKARGGLSYMVILAKPARNDVVPKLSVTPSKNVSAKEIDQKLKDAEVRRRFFEQRKLADISSMLAKIDEATRKKDEIANEFITQTKEQLESKMEHVVENREAIISDIKKKLQIHSQEIEKNREQLEQNKFFEKIAIEEKLKSAQFLRDENKKRMLVRLKKHNTVKIAEVKNQNVELETQKNKEKVRIYENKLSIAKLNRERDLQMKIKKLQQLELHARIVRQNKASARQLRDEENNSNSPSD